MCPSHNLYFLLEQEGKLRNREVLAKVETTERVRIIEYAIRGVIVYAKEQRKSGENFIT